MYDAFTPDLMQFQDVQCSGICTGSPFFNCGRRCARQYGHGGRHWCRLCLGEETLGEDTNTMTDSSVERDETQAQIVGQDTFSEQTATLEKKKEEDAR